MGGGGVMSLKIICTRSARFAASVADAGAVPALGVRGRGVAEGAG